jgi:hypothetical protein
MLLDVDDGRMNSAVEAALNRLVVRVGRGRCSSRVARQAGVCVSGREDE